MSNIEPVSKRISKYVTDFVNDHIGVEFTAGELRLFVSQHIGFLRVAPGSPDRIMRNLRQRGVINYELVDRAKSRYKGLLPQYNDFKGTEALKPAAVPQADGDGSAA